MKNTTVRICALMASVSLFATQALADGCMKPEERAALKVETLQQELMVAALTCDDATAYNAFVEANRAELIHDDQNLEAFYSRLYKTSGGSQFQTVKTRLANHFSLDSLHHGDGFCGRANALFANLQNRDGQPLAKQVSWISVEDTKEACEAGAPVVETIEGASGGLPRTHVAKQAPPAPAVAPTREADNDYYDDGPPPQMQRVARNDPRWNYAAPQQNSYAQPQRDPRAYNPPPPSYYPPPGYYYPPPGYYDGYGW